MKLRKGINVTIGHRTWTEEIPDDKFEFISNGWPEARKQEFIEKYAEKPKKKKKDE